MHDPKYIPVHVLLGAHLREFGFSFMTSYAPPASFVCQMPPPPGLWEQEPYPTQSANESKFGETHA